MDRLIDFGGTTMNHNLMIKGFPNRFVHHTPIYFLIVVTVLFLLLGNSAWGATRVTASGQGGKADQILPDMGGAFDLNVPLTKNAVNTILVTAVDAYGNKVSKEISVTQVSLNDIVVSRVTTERLTVQQVEQLVSEGVLKLDNPENYHVSKFDIVLTIAKEPVAISLPIAVPKEEITGWETYRLPKDDLGWQKLPQEKPEIIVFEQKVSLPEMEPLSIPGVIVIEGRIKSLKEFYSVRLLLLNTSGIFTLKEVMANIEFPDGGLSKILPADGIIAFGNILPGDGNQPGQVEKEFIIRGDEIGTRQVKVNFGGLVTGPGIPEDKAIPFNGSAFSSVEVKGPPTFKVKVYHPDVVAAQMPYELRVDITNTGDIPAMYASLELEVGADAELVTCENTDGEPKCNPIQGPEIRNFGHILQGQTVRSTFTVNPLKSGFISSCVGISDQNITLQVHVGNLGCMVGHFPPELGAPEGIPTVTVLPVANATAISIDSPVTALFSEKMNEPSITTGDGGSFNVYDRGGRLVPGQLRFTVINDKTMAIWQVNDNITNRLAPEMEYTVVLTRDILDLQGNRLFNEWRSRFTTTGMGLNDTTPPTLTLSIEPPVNPNYVLPGQIIKVDAYAADQGSGVARVELRIKDLSLSGAPYVLIDQKSVFNGTPPPYIFSIDSAHLSPGHSYQLLGTAYDGMGNTRDATIAFVLAATADPPTIALPEDDPLPTVLYGITVNLTPVRITGGVREVRYYLDGASVPYATVTLPPYQAGLKTLNLGLGLHTVRVVAEDGLGQTGEDAYTFNLVENLNMPTVQMLGITSGANFLIGSSFTLRGVAEDPVGIQSVHFYLDLVGSTPIASGIQTFTVNTAGLSEGLHTLYMVATNLLGVSNNPADPASQVQFNVLPLPNGPPPAAPVVSTLSYPVNGQVTLSGISVPGARIDITNNALGVNLTVNADAAGVFTAKIAADIGQTIILQASDFTQSQQPSVPTTVLVPAPPVLTHITLTPTDILFTAANAYQDLMVVGHFDDGTTANLTSQAAFSSSHPAVASVNKAGRVAAIGNGTAYITADVEGRQAQATVSVNIVTMTRLSVEPVSLYLVALGQTQPLTVTAHYSDGSSQVLTSGIVFATADPAVATVSTSGWVTAVGNGNTQITVSRSGLIPVQVEVTVNTGLDPAPTVTILTPPNGSEVERGRNLAVTVRAQDAFGGVKNISLEVSGETSYSETKQIAPASLDVTRSFTFSVSPTAVVGGTVTVTARAEDTSGNLSLPASILLQVVDRTAPTVSITQPAQQTAYNYGDTVHISVSAVDAVGVVQIRYQTTGALTYSGIQTITPGAQSAEAHFSFTIPYGVTDPQVRIQAYARDAQGNEGAAAPVDIILTDADITPPETRIVSAADPGAGPATTLTYEVLSGLADLDYVLLYFRRNGIGTFNLYTNAEGGYPEGKYFPQNGNIGTIVFDSTKMGGDGTYEFYTVGVDKAGNREPAPLVDGVSPKDYPGLLAYYPFNGTGWDESGTGVHGTLYGAVFTADRFGKADRALQLNGSSDYVSMGKPVPTALQIQNEITLAAWIYVSQYPASNTLGTIVGCQYDPNRVGYAIHLDGRTNPDGQTAPAGHIHFQIGDGSWHPTHANAQVPLNQWVHVAATRKGNEPAKIYYNGLLQTSADAAWSGTIGYTGAEMAIGRQSDYGNRYFNGLIDEVVIYQRALTPQEIKELASWNTIKPDKTVEFNAGTVWTVITTPTVIGPGDITYDDKNLRISGTTVTIDGAHRFKNVELLNGAVLTHPETSLSVEYEIHLDLWTLTVDGTSFINVDGRGYLGGNREGNDCSGQTQGNVDGSTYRSGGSYGGVGGTIEGTTNPVYGNFAMPADPGSGGSCGMYSSPGGDGGGKVQIKAVNIISDGRISANGSPGGGWSAGSGSGGSIYLITSTLSGVGPMTAHGGAGEVGGGGGRIAVHFVDMSTKDTKGIQALGGQGSSRAGANGTVFLKNIAQTGGTLVVDGRSPSDPYTSLPIPPGYIFDGIVIRNQARVVADTPLVVTGKLSVEGGSILTHSLGSEAGLVIQAGRVEVDETSSIDVSAKGYRGGNRDGNVHCEGVTLGGLSGARSRSGGSYGGLGGVQDGPGTNPVYGHPAEPAYLGSGGSCGMYSASGGHGGGLVRIVATEAVVVKGSIKADGSPGGGWSAGSGSGGSIWIRTSLLDGTGTIQANGGAGEVGGGGGRIALYYDYLGDPGAFGSLRQITAFGGHGSSRWGSAGTVLLKRSDQEYGDLYIDDDVSNATSSLYTPLTLIGYGRIQGLTADTLTTDGVVQMTPNGLKGLEINPNMNQAQTYRILSNTATTITVELGGKPELTAVAAVGDIYAGVYRFDNVYFRRGGFLVMGDPLKVSGTLRIDEYGRLTHYDATMHFESLLDLTVGRLEITATGSIQVDGRGYLGGNREGNDCTGQTYGNTEGSTYRSGGSYGGLGGKVDGVPNPVYGSFTDPEGLGSGGSCGMYSSPGGDGGGWVNIQAGTVVLDGLISANGSPGGGWSAGSGSGGSIWIRTSLLDGTGTIQANGGAGEVGGGGGRIAIRYSLSFSLPLPNITTTGGQGTVASGQPGSIYIHQE